MTGEEYFTWHAAEKQVEVNDMYPTSFYCWAHHFIGCSVRSIGWRAASDYTAPTDLLFTHWCSNWHTHGIGAICEPEIYAYSSACRSITNFKSIVLDSCTGSVLVFHNKLLIKPIDWQATDR